MEIEGSTLTPEEMGYFHKTIGPDEVLIADDTYPTEPLGLKVYGNTRQNLWKNPSGTSNGVTVTSNEDGSVTVSGTSSGNSSVVTSVFYTLKPGETYILSIDKETDFSSYGFFVQSYDGSRHTTLGRVFGATKSAKITVPSSSVGCRVGVQVTDTTEISGTYRVMLNEGSEAQPWCPPGLNSVEDVTVWQSGKNLLNKFSGGSVAGGLTGTVNDDGSIDVSGTYTGSVAVGFLYASGSLNRLRNLLGRKVTISLAGAPNNRIYMQLNANRADGTSGLVATTMNAVGAMKSTGTIPNDVVSLIAFIGVKPGFSGTYRLYPQIELGEEMTEYEPPSATSVPIDLDGNQLCSLPDGTRDELRVDESGAVTLVKRVGHVELDGSQSFSWQRDINSAWWQLDDIARMDDYSQSMLCDRLPVKAHNESEIDLPQSITGYKAPITTFPGQNWVYARTPSATDATQVRTWFTSNPTLLLYKLAEEQEIPLDAVTLPSLPAPNLTAYSDSDVPCDMELEYVYDPYYGYSDLLHGMSWLRVDYDGDDASENYSSRVDLGGNRLFALSDELKDELDVISGTIRKRTMYGVLVGTESWSEKTDSTGSQHEAYYQMDIAGGSFSPESDEQGGLFGRLQTKDPKSNDGPCAYCFADSTGIHIRMRPLASAVAGLDGFKDWLSQNYVPYVRYLFEGEEDLSITPVNLPELYDPDVTVGISFG